MHAMIPEHVALSRTSFSGEDAGNGHSHNDHHCLEQPDWWETSATAVPCLGGPDLPFL